MTVKQAVYPYRIPVSNTVRREISDRTNQFSVSPGQLVRKYLQMLEEEKSYLPEMIQAHMDLIIKPKSKRGAGLTKSIYCRINFSEEFPALKDFMEENSIPVTLFLRICVNDMLDSLRG